MAQRSELECKLFPAGSQAGLKYVVVCSLYQGKWMLSRHKKRRTWETQGGHIEAGETPLEAAKRELFEESGVKNARLCPLCDYLGCDNDGSAYGAVFLAVIESLGDLPESEMAEVGLFETLPEDLTYPKVTPVFVEKAKELWETIKGEG